MSSVVLKPDPLSFPPGTVVQIYTRPKTPWPETGQPPGALVAEPTVANSGTLTVEGLTAGERYVGWQRRSNVDYYMNFVGPGATSERDLTRAEVEALVADTADGGEVEGALVPQLGGARLAERSYKVKGNLVLQSPTGAPAGFSEALIRLTQDASGAHKISTTGIVWIGAEPEWNEAPNGTNVISLFTTNGGTIWSAVGPAKGATGSKGETGETGFSSGSYQTPKTRTWKEPGSGGNELLSTAAQAFDRFLASDVVEGESTRRLTSGTPVFASFWVPPKTKIVGVGVLFVKAEATPTNRQHLWVSLHDALGNVLKVSQDYSSSEHFPIERRLQGMTWDAALDAYVTGSEPVEVIAAVTEVVSAGNPATIGGRAWASTATLMELAPALCGTGTAAQTTPAAMLAAGSIALNSANGNPRPYMTLLTA